MKNRIKHAVLLLVGTTIAMLSSCVYTETMDARERERQGLQKDLDYENERGRKLGR